MPLRSTDTEGVFRCGFLVTITLSPKMPKTELSNVKGYLVTPSVVMNLADWGSSSFVYIICALRCNLVAQDRLPRSGSEKRHFALNAKFLLPSNWIPLQCQCSAKAPERHGFGSLISDFFE